VTGLAPGRADATACGVDAKRQLERLLTLARDDENVLAVILFGSGARGDHHAGSDVDVCLVLTAGPRDAATVGHILLSYASAVDLDVQVFQRLPLYVRRRVLKEGRVLFVRDEDALYDEAFRTVRAYESFRPRYQAYLAEVARRGS
jgi:predicted nucleotidyltransferase